MVRSDSINPEPIRPLQGEGSKSHSKKVHHAPADVHRRSTSAAHRKFMAEAAAPPKISKSENPALNQLINDLTNLNKNPGNTSLWDKVLTDIGGVQNLSAVLIADPSPQSLVDLATALGLTKTAAKIQGAEAQFQAQLTADLTNLDNHPDNVSFQEKVKADIGGVGNLSSFRIAYPSPQSILDFAASLGLTKAAAQLLNMGFQFQSISADGTIVQNDLAPRYQWDNNGGYCGETSILNAALNNGEYISQYDLRQMATGSQYPGMLVLGSGEDDSTQPYAGYVAKLLHLNATEWNTDSGDTKAFLSWVKQQVLAGNPVIIGVYMNQYTFSDGQDTDPNSGQTDYDHIVTVTGIGTKYPSSDPTYHGDDTLYFSDNGLYGNGQTDSPYQFSYGFDQSQGTRQQANSQDPNSPHNAYTLPDEPQNNYGISITGVTDPNHETFPVHLLTNINDEPAQPPDKVPNPGEPKPSPMTLTGCISGLTAGKTYNIYVYDDVSKIPDSDFNGNAKQAMKCITFTATGPNYVFSQKSTTDQTMAFRVVEHP